MSLENFLPLRREVRNHWAYKDNDYFKIWVEMLFCARYSEESSTDIYNGQLYTINYGEFLFSRRTWSDRLSVGEGKTRKFVELAIKDDMITQVGRIGKKGATIYKINNYKTYNYATEQQPTQTPINKGVKANTNPHLTHQKPTSNPPLTTKEERKKERIKDIVEYLNEKANKNYLYSTKKTQTFINARLEEGFTIDDFKKVIDIKAKDWLGNKEWDKYLRPETLFGTKFEGYLNEAPKEVKQPILVNVPKRISIEEVLRNGSS